MKLALIPPHQYVGHMFATNYHLLLPECMTNERYMGIAYELCHNPSHYVILDNGAAEGKLVGPEPLFTIADELQVNEIVIPDVLTDAMSTVEELHKFMRYASDRPVQYNYMFVCQGTTVDECLWTIDRAMFYSNINTIGIPKHLLQTLDDKQVRLKLVKEIMKHFGGRFELHLLGASPLWVGEAKVAATVFEDEIRGMDTSIPYYYGWHGEWITDEEVRCVRQEDYFNSELTAPGTERKLLWNVNELLKWVEGEETSVSGL